MSRYYYTIASLPMLAFESDPPFGIEDFQKLCEAELKADDLERIRDISLIPPVDKTETGIAALDGYYSWDRNLRNELAALRARKKGPGSENPDSMRETEPRIRHIAQQAHEHESPLAGEAILNGARWDMLDDLESGHYFDLDCLAVYTLRLLLLKRKSLFRKEDGEKRFTMIMEHFKQSMADLEHFDE
ncbi:MAG: DUF2764 family protein [Spirochaetales bacterium]|nr:DUF2764 family protein [Spirochaetales bacterium]